MYDHANLLPSKPLTLLIGLKQQLANSKIPVSALLKLKILALSLMHKLPSLIRSHHCLNPTNPTTTNPVILIFVNFAVSVLTLIPKHPTSLIATSIVHSKLDYCNSFTTIFLTVRYIDSNTVRTLLLAVRFDVSRKQDLFSK